MYLVLRPGNPFGTFSWLFGALHFLSRDIHGESRSLRCPTFVRLKDPEGPDGATGMVQMQVEFN